MLTEILNGLAFAISAMAGLAIIVLLIILKKQIAKPVINLFGKLISPRWNNWILGGLWLLTIILFIIAAYRGGGEPFGLRGLKEIAKIETEDQMVKYYTSSTKYFTDGPVSKDVPSKKPVEKQRTWFWWKLWFISFIAAIIYIPLGFWDEVVAIWHRGEELLEQRRRIIPLRERKAPPQQPQPTTPTSQTQAQPIPTPQAQAGQHASFLTRFRERFAAAFSADVTLELIEAAFKRFGRRIVSGKQ